ncbi:unnamed protein product, partial [Dibothriocephalus latus]
KHNTIEVFSAAATATAANSAATTTAVTADSADAAAATAATAEDLTSWRWSLKNPVQMLDSVVGAASLRL